MAKKLSARKKCNTCGSQIEVSIFKGTGYCSAICTEKAKGKNLAIGELMMVTSRERQLINAHRSDETKKAHR